MTSKPTFEINNITYKLSIQLNLNGFSFCIANSESQIVVFEAGSLSNTEFTAQELESKLKEAFETKPELQAKFTTVEVVYANDLYCFVPKQYYDSTNKSVYFNYTIKTLVTDYISEDQIDAAAIVNLFIPYVNINNLLLERFSEFTYRHSSSLLLTYILKREVLETDKKVYLYFHQNHFDVVVVEGSKLLLFNTFTSQSKEDVLYYVLFVMEQLELSPDSIHVKLLNLCSDETYNLLHTYVRNVTKSTSDKNILIHRLALNL